MCIRDRSSPVDCPTSVTVNGKVFTNDSTAGPDAIEVVLHRLRRKLADSDVRIVTVRGLGYMLESIADGSSAPASTRLPGEGD